MGTLGTFWVVTMIYNTENITKNITGIYRINMVKVISFQVQNYLYSSFFYIFSEAIRRISYFIEAVNNKKILH